MGIFPLNHHSKLIPFSHIEFSHKPNAMCVMLCLLYVFSVVETAVETSWHFFGAFSYHFICFSHDGAHILNRGPVFVIVATFSPFDTML